MIYFWSNFSPSYFQSMRIYWLVMTSLGKILWTSLRWDVALVVGMFAQDHNGERLTLLEYLTQQAQILS